MKPAFAALRLGKPALAALRLGKPEGEAVIHKCRAPEKGYWGEVPAMPGCASQGATRETFREWFLAWKTP